MPLSWPLLLLIFPLIPLLLPRLLHLPLLVLIPCERRKLTSKINSKCVHKVSTKIIMRKLNDTEIFVDDVETQLRQKPLRGSQTQDIHYSEDKARYKIVTVSILASFCVWTKSLMCNDAVNRDSTCQSIFRRLCTV
jgi:hypothetical protein